MILIKCSNRLHMTLTHVLIGTIFQGHYSYINYWDPIGLKQIHGILVKHQSLEEAVEWLLKHSDTLSTVPYINHAGLVDFSDYEFYNHAARFESIKPLTVDLS